MDYCYEAEMPRAPELQDSGMARVIPVIRHPCDWHRLHFDNLQTLPKDGKAISKYSNLHDAFLEVTQGISAVAEEFESSKPTEPRTNSDTRRKPAKFANLCQDFAKVDAHKTGSGLLRPLNNPLPRNAGTVLR